jgi:NSS family neurotransmitter:Na+ symporter
MGGARCNRSTGWPLAPTGLAPRLAQLDFFGLMDFISANVLMPLSALLVSVFVGWRLGRRIPEAELSGLSPNARRALMFALRFCARSE